MYRERKTGRETDGEKEGEKESKVRERAYIASSKKCMAGFAVSYVFIK